jgi:hypothetical protein
MSGIDQRIAELPPGKLALLLERLRQARPAAPPAPPIRARRRAGSERLLSYAQERLWFVEQLSPGGSDYNVPAALRLRGTVHRAAFDQALGELLRRHEVLRTSFRAVDGRPVATVARHVDWAPRRIDLSGLPGPAAEAEAERLARRGAARPFDLARPPLLRVCWVDLAPSDQLLLLTLHHIVCDGWSLGVLAGELAELYRAFLAGRSSPLPEPAAQYTDYAEWQREQLQGERMEECLRYWRRQLRDAPAEIALRGAAAAGTGQARRAADEPLAIGGAAAAALRALRRDERATPFMVLTALFSALLYAESGQEDLSIGANAAHRGDLEREGLVGFFVNQVVLRVRLRPAGSFRELLREVRTVIEEAHAHQDLPFERLVEALCPERSACRAPLFQVKVEFKEDAAPLDWHGLDASGFEVAATPLRCDLLLTAAETAGEIAGTLTYDTGRFHAEAMRLAAANLVRIAGLAAAEPDASVLDVSRRAWREAETQRAVERARLDRLAAVTLPGARRKRVAFES